MANESAMLESLRRCHSCGHTRDRHTQRQAYGLGVRLGFCHENGCKCWGYEERCAECGHGESEHALLSGACMMGDATQCQCPGFRAGFLSSEGRREARRIRRVMRQKIA